MALVTKIIAQFWAMTNTSFIMRDLLFTTLEQQKSLSQSTHQFFPWLSWSQKGGGSGFINVATFQLQSWMWWPPCLTPSQKKVNNIYTPPAYHSPWKMMVLRILSFWHGNFSGAMLNLDGVRVVMVYRGIYLSRLGFPHSNQPICEDLRVDPNDWNFHEWIQAVLDQPLYAEHTQLCRQIPQT